jgi:hypothetical protein
MEWAIIENNTVINTIVADEFFIETNFPGAIRIDNITPKPARGFTYIDGKFEPQYVITMEQSIE